MKPIVYVMALLGAASASAQDAMSLRGDSMPLVASYTAAAYSGSTAAATTSGQNGTYPQFSELRKGISEEMADSLNGLLEDKLATDLAQRESFQMQR